MKTTCMLSLPFVFSAAVIAQADTSAVQIPNLTFAHRTNLIDTDQSQTFETLSVADGFTRLPSSAYQTAGVYFITNDKGQIFGSMGNGNDNTFDDPTGEYCARNGFTITSCSSGLFNKACPYNDKIYDKCCDASYKYTASQCSYPKKLSSDTCGGKYKCLCDTSYYSYTYCDSPKVKGSACTDDSGTYYSSCSCPTGVSAPYGCETYYASPCSTKCKKAYSDNCGSRTAVQTPYGCEKYYADCSSKCEKAYTDNCRNRIAVSAPNGCESYYADCASKCEVAYGDNCRNRTAVDTPNGCEKYFADCPSKCEKAKAELVVEDKCSTLKAVDDSKYGCEKAFDDCPDKCEIAYEDNCRNRTAVSAPNGCEKYYADCSTKCAVAKTAPTASTDNCHNRTAVSTPYGCEKYFSDCPSKCEKAYADNCHNRTAVIDDCPDNATCRYFSDCKSKIESYKCRSSRNCIETENRCLCLGDIVHGDGTVKSEMIEGKTPIGVVINLEKHLAISLTYVKKDGTPGAEAMPWSSGEGCAVPSEFYDSSRDDPNDGSVVTSQILAATCNGTPYAAKACNAYQPAGCAADFCKKGKWFLGTWPEYYHFPSIKEGLEAAGGYYRLPEKGDSLWTSTTISATFVWRLSGSVGGTLRKNDEGTSLKNYARPLVKF